ncbi:hypothetical protein ACGYU5_15165 [Burkholderia pseudomallei]
MAIDTAGLTGFFDIEALVIQQLQANVPSLGFVGSARNMKEVFARQVPFPAALVLFNKHRPLKKQTAAFGAFQAIEQVIEVVIVDDNQVDYESGAGARIEAGPIVLQVLQTLLGWIPSPAHTNLQMEQGAQAAYVGGLAYFPFAFSTQVFVNAGATL